MAKGTLKWILYIVAACLVGLGVLFIIAANEDIMRLIEGLIFVGLAFIIAFFSREKKPIEIKKTVRITGPIKVKEINCPNCSAMLNPDKLQVIDGKPYITCDYCGNKFEMTEEPTW